MRNENVIDASVFKIRFPFPKIFTLESVFEKFCFCRHTLPFSIAWVWTKGENGQKVYTFKRRQGLTCCSKQSIARFCSLYFKSDANTVQWKVRYAIGGQQSEDAVFFPTVLLRAAQRFLGPWEKNSPGTKNQTLPTGQKEIPLDHYISE